MSDMKKLKWNIGIMIIKIGYVIRKYGMGILKYGYQLRGEIPQKKWRWNHV